MNLDRAAELFVPNSSGSRLFFPPEPGTEAPREFGQHLSSQALEDLLSSPELTNVLSSSLNKEDENLVSILKNEQAAEGTDLDQAILDEFLWLFQDCATPWLGAFRNRQIIVTQYTRKEWYLAMAAIGALYCPIDGSCALARWLYHYARQSLYAFVRWATHPEPDSC